jgi:hypothetical protein
MKLSFTRSYKKLFLLSILFLAGSFTSLYATHLRAGEIIVERVNCPSLTFRITITVYTNTKNTTVLFGGDQDVLDFGDGTPTVLVPETPNTIRLDLNPDGSVATASFTTEHTYAGPGKYLISYREPNRNEGVLNMDNSVNTTFYIETLINIDPYFGCNNTPKLLIPPIDRGCKGVAFFHNPGAYDPDGDSLSYEMKVPFSDRNTEVVNYRDPNNAKFYTNFGSSNENANGPPTFAINPITGTITWDAPGAIGEYNIAFHVVEWRKIGGVWYPIGYVRRDMQIIIEDCKNERPDLIIPKDTCVVAGEQLKAIIKGTDPDNDPVKIEAFSEIFNFPTAQSPATYSPVPGPNDFRPSNPPAETTFIWNTECIHVKEQPYQVVFKITDNHANGPRLVTFKTWFIRVVGPAPKWDDINLNLANRSTTLKWDPYFCQNAETIQVWRKVDGSPFVPDNCQTGMPEGLGYQLIKTLPVKNGSTPVTSYVDNNGGKGLAAGAKYCYRLVAVFPLPKGGESYVSTDTCVGPILADVPVITHVTVDKTNLSSGQIRVSWRSPFDVNKVQFPPPYKYDVYRATGLVRGGDSTRIANNLSDTTYLDNGLNTEDNPYNYSIAAYDRDGKFVGTSAAASSVRLSAQSAVDQIELDWTAFVPWSNQIQTYPNKHLIYRGPEGASESDLVLIDSVDVSSTGFIYVDDGKHGQLQKDQTYCYRVLTRGGYGNPKIKEPLINFSQILCAQLGDTIPPCKPVLQAQFLDCDQYLNESGNCNPNQFSNTIFWEKVRDADCDQNILGYKIYRSNRIDGEFEWLENAGIVTDTFFVDNTVTSFAYCYKISAVDRSLNESEQSDPVCNDNCPYYELPNVFTPDGDGCNDLFIAYGGQINSGEVSKCPPVQDLSKRCARFVQSVVFRVYNRWGREVYNYEGKIGDERTIYIYWNGKDNNGTDLSTGVYYYIADVTFDIVSANKTKKYKGWVHILRGDSK